MSEQSVSRDEFDALIEEISRLTCQVSRLNYPGSRYASSVCASNEARDRIAAAGPKCLKIEGDE